MRKAQVKEEDSKTQVARSRLEKLYESDETAWLDRMARLIDQGHYDRLDFKNLSEFLTSMAIRDRREVKSRLRTLLTHLLKWDHHPEKRTRSWTSTIHTQRSDLADLLESKTLRNHAADILAEAYSGAVKRASIETGLPEKIFPAQCPYTIDELLASE
jgi:hypothetical protein